IAKSGTKEFLSRLTGDQKKDAHLIGQFGVGFYSAFVVADKVTVRTRRAGVAPELGVCWESAGTGDYTIYNVAKQDRGTEVVLHLKEGELEFLNDWRLRSIISKYSDHVNLPILMLKTEQEEKEEQKASPSWEQVNRATALWTLPKNEITEEQYKEFYKHLAHDFQDPLAWAYNRVEGGNLDYISLLYLPAQAPFDIWNREKQRGLKLYVQRVFIMDQVEQFVPMYLRFIRGIVDTNALPLNVSRELLQDHPAVTKLRAALIKRTLDLLDSLAKDEPEKYAKFWEQFGNVLKEGPGEDFVNRERIAKLLRFSSTASEIEAQNVSFEAYVGRMKPKQKKIYYIVADSYNAAKSSPHLEIFRKNEIEVLLFHDRIDEWFVAHFPEFEGKSLQSVMKGDLSLDDIAVSEDKEQLKQEDEKTKENMEPLLKHIKGVLGEQVKDIRISHRLTSSPACLVREQHDMGPQLERLLKSVGQEVAEVKPILEVNPHHKLIEKLQSEKNETEFSDWTKLLYDQAVLAEGGQLKDPAAFVQRMNKLWLDMI
ncbi:MAG TPA: molecular chaperone HtpG, partial [Gammaproteobacteria bacterium]|nr:molecular chaperone HtpG [Gammaproteobacteria bacterium]